MHWVRGGAGAEVVGPLGPGGGRASALLRFFFFVALLVSNDTYDAHSKHHGGEPIGRSSLRGPHCVHTGYNSSR
jgi:hypothetical protein